MGGGRTGSARGQVTRRETAAHLAGDWTGGGGVGRLWEGPCAPKRRRATSFCRQREGSPGESQKPRPHIQGRSPGLNPSSSHVPAREPRSRGRIARVRGQPRGTGTESDPEGTAGAPRLGAVPPAADTQGPFPPACTVVTAFGGRAPRRADTRSAAVFPYCSVLPACRKHGQLETQTRLPSAFPRGRGGARGMHRALSAWAGFPLLWARACP